jgi:hypothetical protein
VSRRRRVRRAPPDSWFAPARRVSWSAPTSLLCAETKGREDVEVVGGYVAKAGYDYDAEFLVGLDVILDGLDRLLNKS